ncbi:L,D-transpeptidase [Conexibacter woesei]|uniref:ErfK/YbiS/YcfS/YnhG family protein n=1 Tax=Conexibacter woesei (strain DSM 14684 / CCUG 47730 / CIP 108061 / JCM 11494 / NBRC 100937 / ID131577) TaxID=469383 RepID=D3F9X7_CONWI|nr:L,D-transpeptidase [Conexibacter woesei]ADB53072.1 ErfK/YbiS/YcfS/YnhG family protein [Conexibacter woesei DSM 14684]
MSRGSRRAAAVVLTAAAVGLAAAADPGSALGADPAARAAEPAVAAPSTRRAWTARVVAPVAVRAAPTASSRRTGRVLPVAKWNGGSVRLLVLESHRERGSEREHGGERLWLRVALPERPNGRSGWIDADAVRLAPVRWRVEVDVDARRAAAFHDGREVRSWRVVVGAPGTVTPRGLFAVYERVRQPAGSELGPYALHLTAHSDTLFDYGGGRGRVALHGRAGALLADPLGSASSHGCVRMDSAVVTWLAARAGPGTPVLVR